MAASPTAAAVNLERGVTLASLSAAFIGCSFIIKKVGLHQAGATGVRAAAGGFDYLRHPLWWAGLLAMGLGEACNVAAYAYAPAALVTPLGGLSILVAALLAYALLGERLTRAGWLGGALCIAGSVVVVLHAPEEPAVVSLDAIVASALRWPFVFYTLAALATAAYLAAVIEPRLGSTSPWVPVAICSLLGSVSVCAVKAVALAARLSLAGSNQFNRLAPWLFILFTAAAVTIQLLYLNRALDAFPAAVVTPTYYVLFTFLTLTAAAALYGGTPTSPAAGVAGLVGLMTTVAGVVLLHDGVQSREGGARAGEAVQLTGVRGGRGSDRV